jgi:hypothetical protein
MLRPRRSVRNGAIEKKTSVSSSTSNPIPSPPSPPQISNQEEPEQPLRLLEPRECVGRSIQIGLNEEIELVFKNPPSSDRSSPIPSEIKIPKTETISNDTNLTDDPPKFQRTERFLRYIEPTQNELDEMVEYEMDEMVKHRFVFFLYLILLKLFLFRILHGLNKLIKNVVNVIYVQLLKKNLNY